MKRLPLFTGVVLVALLSGAALSVSAPKSQKQKLPQIDIPVVGLNPANWRLVFNDEFSTPKISLKNWQRQRDDWIKGGIPYSNLEGPPYRPANARVSGGNLRLVVRRKPTQRPRTTTASVNARSRLSFKYGYLEARILVPSCKGCWPSFWLLPKRDVWPPEIDIFEYFNTAKSRFPYSAVHWPTKNPRLKERYTSKRLSPTDRDDHTGQWHTYGMLWDSRSVKIYFDGALGAAFSKRGTIPQEPMYPIMQLAVGRGHKPTSGSTMRVDHVRLWQKRR